MTPKVQGHRTAGHTDNPPPNHPPPLEVPVETSESPSVTRLQGLREMRDDLRTRMSRCDSDQNFAVMGRLLADTLKQIDEIDPPAAIDRPEDDVDEFTRRLRERESGTPAPRKAKS